MPIIQFLECAILPPPLWQSVNENLEALCDAAMCCTSAVAAPCPIIIIAIAHHSNRHHQERVRPNGAKSRQQRALNPFYLTHKTIRHHYHLCHRCYQHCQHHYQSSLGNVSGKD